MTRAPLPLHRYHQIYLVLREQLMSGRLPPDQPLPGEMQLARDYAVSRVTIRAALDQLSQEGLVRRERGRGTFPSKAGTMRHKGAAGFFDKLLKHGLRLPARIVELSDVPASSEVAAALGLEPGAPVQKAIRVRSYENKPVGLITTYVPADVAHRFGGDGLAAKPMLQLLEEAGVKASGGEQTITAQLADHHAAALLEVGIGSPLLAIRRIVYGPKRRPVQYLLALYRPDRYEYRMQLSRGGRDPGEHVTHL